MQTIAQPPRPVGQRVDFWESANFLPRQMAAWDSVCDHQYVLYGGAAGGGKSYFLRWCAAALLMRWKRVEGRPSARVGVFCSTYRDLEDRHLRFVRSDFPEWLGSWHEGRHEFTLSGGCGSIMFRNLDDPGKYRSVEFAGVLVDELTELSEDTFDLLRFRMRSSGFGKGETKFVAASNPGGVGHAWVKRLWISRDMPEHLRSVEEEFDYVPATVSDNPHVSEAYTDQLKSLPKLLRAAMLDGSWDVFSGQVFDEFRREIHVVEPFLIPNWWVKWRGNDPGFNDPGVWYWLATDGGGQVYVYREATFNRVPYSDQAKQVVDLTGEGEQIEATVTGMDAFNQHPESGKSITTYYEENGISGCIRPIHGPGSKAARVAIMREYLKPVLQADGETRPRLRIFSTCRKLVDTLPSLPADKNKPEQVGECAVDHWFDAVTYPLAWWHGDRSLGMSVPKYPAGSMGALLDHAESFKSEAQVERELEEMIYD